MIIGLQKRRGLTKYLQLRDIIYSKIESDEYSVGTLIPSESELMERYKVSKATVRQALSELENEGVLRREQGRGTYVESLSKQARKIMVIIPPRHYSIQPNTSIYKLLMGIMEECHELGIEMTSLPLESYTANRVAAEVNFIWPWPENDNLRIVHELTAFGKRVVIINRIFADEPDITWFSTDHRAAAKSGVEKLIERGHRKIGFMYYPNADMELRHQGYLDAMRGAGLEVRPEYVCRWDAEKDGSQLDAMLKSEAGAVMSAQGYILPDLMKRIGELGIKVPEHKEIITFNRIPDDVVYKPYVHEIIEPFREMAHLAVRKCVNDTEDSGSQFLKPDIIMKY